MKRFSLTPFIQKSPLVLSLLCLYPTVSTFAMLMVWQITQVISAPFMGFYYHSWIYIYFMDHTFQENRPMPQILFSAYLLCMIALLVLAILALAKKRLRTYFAWAICGIWVADCGWILREMAYSGGVWQDGVLLAEHLLYLALTVFFSILYLQLKKKEPGRFKGKKKKKKAVYTSRF